MEQKLELVQIYILRKDCETTQIRSHEDAETVFGDDRLIEHFLWSVNFLLFILSRCINLLVIFSLVVLKLSL